MIEFRADKAPRLCTDHWFITSSTPHMYFVVVILNLSFPNLLNPYLKTRNEKNRSEKNVTTHRIEPNPFSMF